MTAFVLVLGFHARVAAGDNSGEFEVAFCNFELKKSG
jgi:hypothetical protein